MSQPHQEPQPPLPQAPSFTTPQQQPGQPQPATYAPPLGAPIHRPTDEFSIAALITGVLGMGPVALGLGIVGMKRTKSGERSGRGLAIAGVTLGALATLIYVLMLGTLAWALVNYSKAPETSAPATDSTHVTVTHQATSLSSHLGHVAAETTNA